VFEAICEFVGCKASSVTFQDAFGRNASVYLTSRIEPEYAQLFLEKYCKVNPIFPAVMFHDVETCLTVEDAMPRDQFVQTTFAQEWLKPQGFVDGLFTPLEKSPVSCTVFIAFRRGRQGLFDAEARQRFEALVPHLRRAILIGKTLDMHRVEAAA